MRKFIEKIGTLTVAQQNALFAEATEKEQIAYNRFLSSATPEITKEWREAKRLRQAIGAAMGIIDKDVRSEPPMKKQRNRVQG